MSATYATPLALQLEVSRRLRWFLVGINLLGALALLSLPWPLPWRLALCLIPVTSLLYGFNRWLLAYRLLWREHDWLIESPRFSGRAWLQGDTLVTPWLTLLSFRLENGRRLSVPVLPDAVHRDAFRRLRVRLKVNGRQSVSRAKLES